MFDQLPSSGRRSRSRTLLLSLTAHMVVLVAVVVAPLIFYRQLEWIRPEVPAVLWTPPPPPPPPRAASTPPRPPAPTEVRLDRFTAPPEKTVFTPEPPTGIEVPTSTIETGATGGIPETAFATGVPPAVVGSGPRAGPPPPPPPAAPKAPLRLSSVDTARLVHRVDPSYPELARRNGVEGVVVLQLLVDRSGAVREVKLLKGHPLLNRAAEKAVSQWRYEPTRVGGEPVEFYATVTVQFRLR